MERSQKNLPTEYTPLESERLQEAVYICRHLFHLPPENGTMYVIKKTRPQKKNVLVVCPSTKQHYVNHDLYTIIRKNISKLFKFKFL